MQNITATLIAYLHTCHRKLWLHANEIRMEYSSELATHDFKNFQHQQPNFPNFVIIISN